MDCFERMTVGQLKKYGANPSDYQKVDFIALKVYKYAIRIPFGCAIFERPNRYQS